MTVGGSNNASALRRVAKRREALATARPFIVATIGFGDAYLYCNGVLCYTLDHRVRILDLHHSAEYEIVISVPGLLTQALPDIGDNAQGHFQILYYSDDIVSCMYRSSGLGTGTWLIALNIKTGRILAKTELDSTDKIFVRHNKQFLYYGTHSEIGADGYKKWVIHGHDFRNMRWFDQRIHLPDLVGSEIGSTICFEFHKDYFYALSNQTSFEVEEIDWTSFYHGVRFPLESPCRDLLEKTDDKSMWRRQHQEGPIDDRWTSLRLHKDESSGDLRIVESRKEWHQGSSRSQRTYYTTDIIFPSRTEREDFYFRSSSSFTTTGTSYSAAVSTTTTTNSPKLLAHDLSTFPNEPILRLLGPDDNPHHMRPPPRLPQNTHPGNDGSCPPTFTIANSLLRHYYTSASTFLDLVNDPLPTDQRTQRLRLRVGSRKLRPPLLYPSSHSEKAGLFRKPSSDLSTALEEMYIDRPIRYWPPAQDPFSPDQDVNALYKLLNPPTHLGNVEGTADERSLVYVTGGLERPQAIVFVGFDPAIRLVGLKRWGGIKEGMCQKGVGEGPHIEGRATSRGMNRSGLDARCADVDEADRTVGLDRKGKGRAKCEPPIVISSLSASVDVQEISESPPGRVGAVCGWAWREKAMYQDIGLGFYFGLERNENT